jgi:hypothetical protein
MINAANDSLDVYLFSEDLASLRSLDHLLFITNRCFVYGSCPCPNNDSVKS